MARPARKKAMAKRGPMGRRLPIDSSILRRLALEDIGPVREAFITSDMTLSDVEALSGSRSLFKKFSDVESADAEKRAIEKFLLYNERCSTYRLEAKSLFDDELIGMVKTILDDWLHPFGSPATLSDFVEEAALGPGASIGCEENDFYTKLFNSRLSASNDALYLLYRSAISANPTWTEAEMARDSTFGRQIAGASALSTVPKQFDIRRTICTEPVLNMFFQLGIGNFLRRILRSRTGIDLSDQQDFNRKLAHDGSVDSSFGTIDLASASDSIAHSLCVSILPSYFMRWLDRTRSSATRLPSGDIVQLNMVSSMGNGFTFPLQTMIFAAIVKACYSLLGERCVFRTFSRRNIEVNAGVFGDDIIVRRNAYDFVCRALQLFGFEVNVDKSFNSGPFRESCGADFWNGHPVRGVYIKKLETQADCYSAINRLIRWSARSGIMMYFSVAYLMGKVRFLPIPPRDGDDEGIKVPFSCSGVSFYSTATRSPLYEARVSLARSWSVPAESAKTYRNVYPAFVYNGAGICIALVGGFVRDGRVSVRSEIQRSKIRLRSVPYWDYFPMVGPFDKVQGDAWQGVAASYIDRCKLQVRV